MKRIKVAFKFAGILLLFFFVLWPVARTQGHSGNEFSSFAGVVPTIDGVVHPGEWDDAACQTNTVTTSTGNLSDLTICVKNNVADLFLLAIVTNQDYSDPAEPGYDFLNFTFDNYNDGLANIGDDGLALRYDNNVAVDIFNPTGVCCHSANDTYDSGTNDLVAVLTHTNPVPDGVGTYTAEYQHPLNTPDDAHDFSLAPGDIVGFKFTMADGDDLGHFDWPYASPAGFADIIIAAAPVAGPTMINLSTTVDQEGIWLFNALAINNRGQIVGQGFDAEHPPWGPYFWDDGSLTILEFDFWALPFDLNDFGQMVISVETADGYFTGVIWENGEIIDLRETQEGVLEVEPWAINKLGEVVGYYFPDPDEGREHGFIWENGALTRLDTFADENSSIATDINTRGQIVGHVSTDSSSYPWEIHAVLWDQGEFSLLESLGRQRTEAFAINKYGQIAGSSQTVSGATHAVVWENGTLIDLGTMAGTDSWARAINDCGQVVGSYGVDGRAQRAFLWEAGRWIDLGTLGGNYSWASDINKLGQVVGNSSTATGETHAFLWTGDDLWLKDNINKCHFQSFLPSVP